ncbi:MAG TPA: tetratricopeptide repeat protein [Kofleriaceae bacterium]
MTRPATWLAIAALLVATRAAADTVEDHLARVRQLYDKGDFARARDELLAAYQLEPRPDLLFALGQVELNIGHYEKAIDYYERFIATDPASDQIALAQQAIGAARARRAEKAPVVPPPRPPPHRRWDTGDTVIAALGGTTLLAGVGLFVYGNRLAGDRTGTLSHYNHRLSRAERTQWIGAGCVAAGALAVGAALLRWRLHLVDSEVQPIVAPRTAGLVWVRRW